MQKENKGYGHSDLQGRGRPLPPHPWSQFLLNHTTHPHLCLVTQSEQDILAPLLGIGKDTEQTQENLDENRAQVSRLLALWGLRAFLHCFCSALWDEAANDKLPANAAACCVS